MLSRAGQVPGKSLLSSRDALGTTAAGLRLRPIGCTRPLPWLLVCWCCWWMLVLLSLMLPLPASPSCLRCSARPPPAVPPAAMPHKPPVIFRILTPRR